MRQRVTEQSIEVDVKLAKARESLLKRLVAETNEVHSQLSTQTNDFQEQLSARSNELQRELREATRAQNAKLEAKIGVVRTSSLDDGWRAL